jgi:glutaminyl-peptide cyclotransferase
MRILIFFSIAALMFVACTPSGKKDRSQSEKPKNPVKVPAFNSDSAYHFLQQQLAFGPRIPNSKPHEAAGNFFVETLKSFGARVSVQEFEATAFNGSKLHLKNIIASYFPEKPKRILLAAHWDTRPFADKDNEKPNATFQGANDGASGVAVLLEIARVLPSAQPPDVGIDIILFDGEDYGERVNMEPPRLPETLQSWWCLGSQHWARNKHVAGYSAYYGILLDMVGATNAQFHKEGYSVEFAPSITDQVWNTADDLGYSHFFIKRNQAGVTDDHLFVNTLAKIPMINIVNYDAGQGYFGDFHHTRNDNLELINRKTLKAVGETVMTVLYQEEK